MNQIPVLLDCEDNSLYYLQNIQSFLVVIDMLTKPRLYLKVGYNIYVAFF